MADISSYIKSSFSGNTRTDKVKRNIVISLLIKCCSIAISLLLVPVTLGYLDQYEYGVWLTLSSVLMWVNYFDIGLANGLRNKLAEALAIGDLNKGRVYVSTTFFLLLAIFFIVLVLFFFLQYFLNWNQILNIDPHVDITSVVSIVFTFFCISFVLKFIGNIYLAKQLSAVNDLFTLLGNALSLIVIVVLKLLIVGSLYNVAFVYSLAPVIIYVIAYPYTFYIKYPQLRPSVFLVKFEFFKDLMNLGVQFFVIQIACLVLFATANVLISQMFGPEQVTPYNIAFKYFSVMTMGFNIIISPLWSAVTEAYVKKDYRWIQVVMRKMILIWLLSVVAGIVMLAFSGIAYYLWVGSEVSIPFSLSVVLLVYILLGTWTGMFASFINGIGKLRIQLYCAIFSSIFFIPLAIVLGRLFGVNGICIAMCVALLPYAFLLPLQYKKIVSNSSGCIWYK